MGIAQFRNHEHIDFSENTDINNVLQIIKSCLSTFKSSDTFCNNIFEGSDENHYTELFIKYIINENHDTEYVFFQQAKQEGRRSVDIAVFLKGDDHYIICIEAKFLRRNSRDYVDGNYSAIQRFKNNNHGLSHTDPDKAKLLRTNSIIAYIIEENGDYFLANVNNRITNLSDNDLSWNINEILKIVNENQILVLKSSHKRIDNSSLLLYHFWLDLN